MDTPGAERRALDQPPSALAPAPEAHHAAHHLRRLLRRLRLCLGRLRLRENFGAPCRGSTLYCTASADTHGFVFENENEQVCLPAGA